MPSLLAVPSLLTIVALCLVIAGICWLRSGQFGQAISFFVCSVVLACLCLIRAICESLGNLGLLTFAGAIFIVLGALEEREGSTPRWAWIMIIGGLVSCIFFGSWWGFSS